MKDVLPINYRLGESSIFLVRHGQTQENKAGLIQGHSHGALTEAGIRQARKSAALLAGFKIEGLYSSDLKRALDTAEIISALHGRLPVTSDPGLREQHLGAYEGASIRTMLRAMRQRGETLHTLNPEGGEPSASFRKRVREYFEKLIAGNPAGNLAVVTHFGVLRALLADFETTVPSKDLTNGCVIRAQVREGTLLSAEVLGQ